MLVFPTTPRFTHSAQGIGGLTTPSPLMLIAGVAVIWYFFMRNGR